MIRYVWLQCRVVIAVVGVCAKKKKKILLGIHIFDICDMCGEFQNNEQNMIKVVGHEINLNITRNTKSKDTN